MAQNSTGRDEIETGDSTAFGGMLAAIWQAAGGASAALGRVHVAGRGSLPSAFAVTDLAAASIAAAGLAVSELSRVRGLPPPAVTVDRRLASFWFDMSLRPQGWAPPPPWDPLAGDYPGADGWIRLHTNAPPHRRAALAVLAVEADKDSVRRAVAAWPTEALETAIVAAGGCAARMRTMSEWAAHEQGRCVAAEPLVGRTLTEAGAMADRSFAPVRPLAGLKVLDLTRVLAGPVATRFLAGYGAQVLRIDPPDWDEPALVPELMVGKRTARLDFGTEAGHSRLIELMAGADMLVHGYRGDALERRGLGAEVRRRIRPGLIDVRLDAYGWSGPWRNRRGFDSLVQMSTGIAEAGMRAAGAGRPTPLPVQALDHATGYIMAATAVLGLLARHETGCGLEARASLARTGLLLTGHAAPVSEGAPAAESEADLGNAEPTAWGPARRLLPPLHIDDVPMRWSRAAAPMGSDTPDWD